MVRKRRKKSLRRPKRPCESGVAGHPDQQRLNRLGKMWKLRKMAKERKAAQCATCTSWFPLKEEKWDCLSGMDGHLKCEEYEFAIFQLVAGWDYSMRQINVMRKVEIEMKAAEGKLED